jgi:dienelactone hydrolase
VRSRFSGKIHNGAIKPIWLDGGHRLAYRRDLPGGAKECILVDTQSGTKTVVPEAEFPQEPPRTAATPPSQRGNRPRMPSRALSPDGKFEAEVREHNVWLVSKLDGKAVQLSRDGQANDGYAGEFYWSADGRRLVAIRAQPGGDRKVTLVESSPRDQVQPKVVTYPYLKPGDPVAQRKPRLFDVERHKEIPVPDTLFANPWSITHLHWSRDGKRFMFLFNQRGHQVMRLLALDVETGTVAPIINEECPTFFDYAHKLFLHRLAGTDDYLWMSERDGWNHLYWIDGQTGAVRRQVTKGAWVVRGVDRVDDATGEAWLRIMGARPEQDPYHVHFARVKLATGELTWLTEGDGTHELEFGPDRRLYLDTYSRADRPPVIELRRASDGKKICDLETADISALVQAGFRMPERFVAKGRDGQTDIWGLIHRPSRFDPTRRYPVIEHIYAGPHDHHVPKRFNPVPYEQSLAELGFIVVKIDGMGTNWRSKAFHDVCWKNLGDSGFPDRIAWIKAAAAKYPEFDLRRGVGIFGGSAGGQSAVRALTEYPDFYTVGVADCGCHDNRMDKIWWNELWMGWPVGPHYAEQSNVTNAHKLKGKVLLVVGEKDTNVDPASTMQVVNALIKADKDFDLLVIPGAGHGAAESPYGRRRRMDFFVRHLLGAEPRQ